MLNYTMSQGIHQKTIENMFLSRIPNRMIFGLCKNSAFSATLKENCFEFSHFDVSQVCLSINGVIVGSSPYRLNYANNNFLLPYMFSYYNTGNHLIDDGNCVGRDQYAEGFCLYAFDISPDLSANDAHWSPQQQGNCRLELTFAKALPSVVNLVVHAEYNDMLEIDRNREISIQYKK
jgi:hypothetical protein